MRLKVWRGQRHEIKWNENHLDKDYSKISGIKLWEIRLLEIKICNDCDLSKYSKLNDSNFSGENCFCSTWHSALCHAAKCWWWLAVLLVSVTFIFPSKIWRDFDIGKVDGDQIPIGSTMDTADVKLSLWGATDDADGTVMSSDDEIFKMFLFQLQFWSMELLLLFILATSTITIIGIALS